jgi:hypothetical protein
LLVLIGTAIQAYLHMLQLRDERKAVGDWWAASELRAEVGFWHPIRRYRRGRAVSKLLADQVKAHTAPQPWWLGYLDTGVDDIVFHAAPK